MLLKKGLEIELRIESLGFGGMGIARENHQVIFVKNAIPGQTVKARIIKKRSSFLEAISIKTIEESQDYVSPPCQHFNECGGCTLQNYKYSNQIIQKEKQVNDLFERIGKFSKFKSNPIIKCNQNYNYRNKMEFTFSKFEWIPEGKNEQEIPGFALGLHVPKRWDKILNINECHIQDFVANEVLQFIKRSVIHLKLEAYDLKEHKGYLRHLVIRKGIKTGQIMVNFVTSKKNIKLLEPIVKELRNRFPSIVSIVNNISTRKAGVAVGEEQILLSGQNFIIDKIGEYNFKISSNSFFQTNTLQAEKLYDIILEEASLGKQDIVYDLCCGIGTISIYLSKYAKKVYGFEIIPSAIQDAKENAKINNIKNTYFFEGDISTIFSDYKDIERLAAADVIIIDPPRPGIPSKTIKYLNQISPRKIIYVSCNPSTQARDIKELCKEEYRLLKLQPVDMFPHTPHIENVATLIKN